MRRKLFSLSKIDGKKNIADIGTKHLARADMERLVERMNVRFMEGRSLAIPLLVDKA